MFKKILTGSVIFGMIVGTAISGHTQQLKKGIGTTMTTHRSAVTTDDHWPQSRTQLGTPIDSTDYIRLRVHVDVSDGETCTVRTLFWNATAGKWFQDSDENETLVAGQETFLVRTNHASSVFFMIDNITGTSPSINLYVEGSNE